MLNSQVGWGDKEADKKILGNFLKGSGNYYANQPPLLSTSGFIWSFAAPPMLDICKRPRIDSTVNYVTIWHCSMYS